MRRLKKLLRLKRQLLGNLLLQRSENGKLS